jgi:MarR family
MFCPSYVARRAKVFHVHQLIIRNVAAVKHNPTQANIREYFWSLVDRDGPLPDAATGLKSKCWLWLGSVTDQGYGRFKTGGKTYMARRYAWREKGGPDLGELAVSTRCGNKRCVRHLHLKSRAEIMAYVAGHWGSGDNSYLARVTSRQVLLIRKLYTRGNVTQTVLAKRFGMSTSNVSKILSRRSWKNI